MKMEGRQKGQVKEAERTACILMQEEKMVTEMDCWNKIVMKRGMHLSLCYVIIFKESDAPIFELKRITSFYS